MIIYEIEGFVYNCDVFFMSNILKEEENPIFVEFGVYAGRSFFNTIINTLILKNMPESNKLRNQNLANESKEIQAIAVDPFPGMHNIKEIFNNNKKFFFENKIFPSKTKIEIINTFEECNLTAGASLFHIDSCHTEKDLIKDFAQAYKNLSKHGVIVCDDVWSDIFPGVTSGCFRCIHEFNLQVFLVTSAKIYICTKENHPYFINIIKQSLNKINCPYYVNFASDSFLQENDIRGMEVLSLKSLKDGVLINNEEKINNLFQMQKI